MEEYIGRNALLKEIADLKKSPWYNDDYGFGTKQARQEGVSIVEDLCIKQAPAAEVKEVVHAKWEWFDIWEGDAFAPWQMLRCSNCLESEGARENAEFCSNCGAIMDLTD